MTAATQTSAFCALRELTQAPAPSAPAPKRTKDDDRALMGRVAGGDRQAIRVLFERYRLKVYRFVLRLVANSATAEDIVSEVFLELWRRAADFEGRAQLSTFILAIARNKAMSALRSRTDQPLDDAVAAAIPDLAPTADHMLDEGRRSAVLRHCLQLLPAAQREIIDLVYYHEKTVEEVATIVSIPAATVKTRMFYARKRLSEYLRAAGIATAAA